MKRWCIINLEDLSDPDPVDLSRASIRDICMLECERLSKRYGPTCFYTDKDLAADELFRLQHKYPDSEFCLFETVGKVVSSQTAPGACHLEDVKAEDWQ